PTDVAVLFVALSFRLPLVSYLLLRPPPLPYPFPYTTLFRSDLPLPRHHLGIGPDVVNAGAQAGIGMRLDDVASEDFIGADAAVRSEEHTSELQSLRHLVCRLLLEKKKKKKKKQSHIAHSTTC